METMMTTLVETVGQGATLILVGLVWLACGVPLGIREFNERLSNRNFLGRPLTNGDLTVCLICVWAGPIALMAFGYMRMIDALLNWSRKPFRWQKTRRNG